MRGSGGITGCAGAWLPSVLIRVVEVAEDSDHQHADQERADGQESQRHHDQAYADLTLLVAGSVRAMLNRVFHD